MKPRDKNYLLLQFRVRILSNNGTEFQSFFENIMEKVYIDFQKIRPYGKQGDSGNDGYQKEAGIYYQVYAPNTPKIKESEAAKKLTEDFQKLKNEWNKISEIKEYKFVFNDKNSGSIQLLEEAISNLQNSNPTIKFGLFLAKNLESVFFQLDESDILSLGFNIDSRKAISNVYKYLEKVEIELDRENSKYALKILENSKDIVSELNDENLSLEYEILECRCNHKLERVVEAKEKYENISIRYPDDPRSFLYLAEIYINNKDYVKNEQMLNRATEIDQNHWLLPLEELIRRYYLGEKTSVDFIDEKKFPKSNRVKSNYYRFYSKIIEDSGDRIKADSFIGKAIHLNPDRLRNYVTKFILIEKRLNDDTNNSQLLNESQILYEEIKIVEDRFSELGEINARSQAILNFRKLNVLRVQENFQDFENISKKTFSLLLSCYFNLQIDEMLANLLMFVQLPDKDFDLLLDYLDKSKIEISDMLAKALIIQFNYRDKLFVEGKEYFKKTNNQKFFNFIDDLDTKNYEKILKFLEQDVQFALYIVYNFKSLPELRKKLIEYLPGDKNIQKEKLGLLVSCDEKNYDEAYDILKNIDLKSLNYFECKRILKIIQIKKAWDFEIIILEKLLEKEKDVEVIYDLKYHLFNANYNLKKYSEAVGIGENLLDQDSNENILKNRERMSLLAYTIYSCLERGKVYNSYLEKAQIFIEKYRVIEPTFEFKVDIEAEVYLKNNKPKQALKSIIDGIKIKKVLTPEEYSKLYFVLSINISPQINLNLDSFGKIEKNSFVKLKGKNRWYFIGDDYELDAIKIAIENDKYPIFINKELKEKIIFEEKYSSGSREEIIEIIYSIEKYILWQSVQNFQNLSKDNVIDGIQMIEVPEKEGSIDPNYLLKYLDDWKKRTEPLFEMYCGKNIVPLAMLAVNEGGLTNAIARIKQENRGYINFSTGNTKELETHKDIAKNIIDMEMPFYLDGTSALFLSEIGLFKKIYNYLPNLKVPQSVISLLIDITEKFRYVPGQKGFMGYAQGKITFSPIDKEKSDLIQSNFIESIKLLESKPENISVISLASKFNCFSEQEVPEELSDACILAQKEKISVLTEDFLYLKMNELETKKKSPDYFSSFVLLKVLYEEGKVNFEEYLDYFGYLSSYRLRFLALSIDDIEKAVLGDGKIKVVSYRNIRKLNFPLTLSEEYGIPFRMAFTVVGGFLLKILFDNTILPEIIERIFIEILESFPTKIDKKSLGQMFVEVFNNAVEQNRSNFIFNLKSNTIQKKLDKLIQATEIYSSETQLWTPS